MIDTKNIKAILFDAGYTLNYPKTGHWFIPPNFYDFVDKSLFDSLDNELVENAFAKGFKYLGEDHLIKTELEELNLFMQLYNMIFNELLGLKLSQSIIEDMAKDMVYNEEKFIFYDDVYEFIPTLDKDYKLGIVSDTWPSLERVFVKAGLRDYFSTFVMSSILGVRKPNKLMFSTALAELNVKPEEALFIDDSIKNIEGALELGMQAILITREEEAKEELNFISISNMTDFQKLLAK